MIQAVVIAHCCDVCDAFLYELEGCRATFTRFGTYTLECAKCVESTKAETPATATESTA